MHTGLNTLLHLIGHAWPPEMLPQQRQGMVMSLMTCISMTPIQDATQWAFGTVKSRRSSVSPLGLECRYKAPWWTMNFCQLHRSSLPSSLEECSTRSAFKSVLFCAFSQFNTVLNIRSSFWALAQLVTCICTRAQPAVTCTSCSKLQSPSTMAGSWTSAWCADPKVTLSRIDFTVSGSRWVVTWLSAFTTVLSHPFWYSNSKLNHTRAPTHQWPIASRLGVIIMYVSGLLSILTRKDWQGRYSLKCSVTAHFSARNSSLVECSSHEA